MRTDPPNRAPIPRFIIGEIIGSFNREQGELLEWETTPPIKSRAEYIPVKIVEKIATKTTTNLNGDKNKHSRIASLE